MTRLARTTKAALMTGIAAAALWAVSAAPRASGPSINLSPFSTAFNFPIGIDFFEPTPVAPGSGMLLTSANYPNGEPNNFQTIDATGAQTVFAAGLHDLFDEIKIATVRNSACTGGFVVGTAFAGNGDPGGILKINPDGTFVNPWVTLPGEPGHIRGSLYQDRACALGGNLIVVTGNEQVADSNGVESPGNYVGNVWRVTSAGVPTLVATINRHLEGVITVPNDGAKYGILAGTIIAGDEDLHQGTGGSFDTYGPNGRLWVITPGGGIVTLGAPAAGFANYPTDVPLHIEDIDLIPQPRPGFASPEGDLFAVDFGNGQVLRAPATDFADKCGQILLTQEFPMGSTPTLPSGFSTLTWDGAKFVVTPLNNTGGANVGHYEHVTFWGGTECTPPTPPNLKIEKVAGSPSINAGDVASFTIKVTNQGPGVATGVTINDPLPAGLTWTDDSPLCGVNSGTLSCNLGDMGDGATFTVTVSATTSTANCGQLSNTATVSGTNEGSNLGDNTATASMTVACLPPPCTVTMGDFVWYDSNLNGIQDAGEVGAPGVTVTLLDSTGTTVLQTTTTDASGHYSFTAPCGTYKIQVGVPTGYSLTLTNQGGDTSKDSNPNPSTTTPPNNGQDLTIDFGLVNSKTLCPPAGSTGVPPTAGTLSWGIDVNGDVHIRYDQNTGLNDNSYGTGAIGWTNGHSFGNLTGSDKAEFILTDGLGTKVLDFFQDYITLQNAAPFTPSHYASLGATGGDGSLVTGNSAWVMNPDSSLAKNLNKFCVNAGCTTLVQGVALTVNSPAADANYNTSNPFFNGWNFVDSFEVTVSHLAFGANGFGAVAVGLVHNSPAKAGTNAITPGDCGTGGGGTGQLVITGKKLDKTEVQITIQNNTGADVFLSGVQLTWPAVNGKLMQVKVGGGVVYDNPDIAPPSANLTMAQLVADQNKRKIPKGTSVVLHLVFEHNVDKNPGNYTGTLTFTNGMTLTILP